MVALSFDVLVLIARVGGRAPTTQSPAPGRWSRILKRSVVNTVARAQVTLYLGVTKA